MLARAHTFGGIMGMVGIIPGLNRLYSRHGGPAWLLLPLAFPIAAVVYARTYKDARPEHLPALRTVMVKSLLIYCAMSLGASFAASYSIRNTFGLPVPPLHFWGLFFFPLNLVAFVSR